MICLLVMTDGRRHLLTQTLASLEAMLSGPITRRIIHDDSGDPAYAAWLAATFGGGYQLVTTPARSGFGGAIRSAWQAVAGAVTEQWVFATEDDFLFTRPVDLGDLAAVLEPRPLLAQMALRRQAWNDAERAAGGVVEANPAAFTDHTDSDGRAWLEHQAFWTTNPSLHRTDMCRLSWPTGEHSEGRFTRYLLDRQPDVRFGYWGARGSGEWIHHIGVERAGYGY